MYALRGHAPRRGACPPPLGPRTQTCALMAFNEYGPEAFEVLAKVKCFLLRHVFVFNFVRQPEEAFSGNGRLPTTRHVQADILIWLLSLKN